ncbi:hypothetical protein [Tenacibaculum singaporense]|uniref:hypothetical protein n=1 Tax=Tenacibaculum singaporense TaxID=2358479 RepID=UPI000F68205E|nr:hypothetical protein [Tenacibaculum singaporense]RSC93663.1 hypothetical protein EI424_06570 [Tenacibaculum singaporense]
MRMLILCLVLFSSKFVSGQDLLGESVEVNYSYLTKDITYCDFYEFKILKDTKLEDIFLNELKSDYIDKAFFELKPNGRVSYLKIESMFKFRFNKKEVAVICYRENDVKQKKVFISDKSAYLSGVFAEISKLSNESFWQFYNSIDDPNFPEINKLKPSLKDANGVLNIEKLAQVLKENKASLAKYLDE